MRVKELKMILSGADDDDVVLVPVPELHHEYRPVHTASLAKVNRGKGTVSGHWWEYLGDKYQSDETNSDAVVAVIIG